VGDPDFPVTVAVNVTLVVGLTLVADNTRPVVLVSSAFATEAHAFARFVALTEPSPDVRSYPVVDEYPLKIPTWSPVLDVTQFSEPVRHTGAFVPAVTS
jgi:hypothetical protein